MLRSALDAESYWETHVRAKKRKEIRRLQKRLAELGAVEQRRLDKRAELPHWCADFLTLEAAGWKGREGTAMACSPSDAAFFRAACAAAFDAGRLHFLRIDLDGRPIAMLANFRHGEGAFSFKIAFDEELGRFSPGVLIELANLHAVQGDPDIGWMDSCAAADHPMIDSLWAERRTIVQYRIALRGRGLDRMRRTAAFALANGAEALASRLKGNHDRAFADCGASLSPRGTAALCRNISRRGGQADAWADRAPAAGDRGAGRTGGADACGVGRI
jgi:hypothetical protein